MLPVPYSEASGAPKEFHEKPQNCFASTLLPGSVFILFKLNRYRHRYNKKDKYFEPILTLQFCYYIWREHVLEREILSFQR